MSRTDDKVRTITLTENTTRILRELLAEDGACVVSTVSITSVFAALEEAAYNARRAKLREDNDVEERAEILYQVRLSLVNLLTEADRAEPEDVKNGEDDAGPEEEPALEYTSSKTKTGRPVLELKTPTTVLAEGEGFQIDSACGRSWFVPLQLVRLDYIKNHVGAEMTVSQALEESNEPGVLNDWFGEQFEWEDVERVGIQTRSPDEAEIKEALDEYRDSYNRFPNNCYTRVHG